MKQKIIILLAFIAINTVFAQTNLQKAVYYELGGDAFKSGIGYDIRGGFGESKFGWSAHATLNETQIAWINYAPFYGSYAPVSLGGSLLFGTTHAVEIGLGVRPRRHTTTKQVPNLNNPQNYDTYTCPSISMDLMPMIAYRFQPKNKYFFGKIYLTPYAFGELSNATYGKLNWFPLSEVQYSLMGLDLGFNIFEEEKPDENPKKLQHSLLLDNGLGIVYDLRFNRQNKKIDYAIEIGAGLRTFASQYQPSAAPQNWHLRGTALFGKGKTRLEAGLQASYGQIFYYPTNATEPTAKNDFFIGFPVGFRYQYPHSGFFARAYVLPAFALNTVYSQNITTAFGLGYTF